MITVLRGFLNGMTVKSTYDGMEDYLKRLVEKFSSMNLSSLTHPLLAQMVRSTECEVNIFIE